MATGRADYPIEPPVVSVLDDDACRTSTPPRRHRVFRAGFSRSHHNIN
jgi:hypothetical protein